MDMARVSTVSEAPSATCVPLHLFGQVRCIEQDDPVPFRPYRPGVPELSQRADHDLAHRTDRCGQILLGDPNRELAARIAVVLTGRRKVEKLTRNPLSHRSESGPGDLVDEGPGALAQLDQERARNAQVRCARARTFAGEIISSCVSTSACLVAGSANSSEKSDIAPKSSPDRQYRMVIVRPSGAVTKTRMTPVMTSSR